LVNGGGDPGQGPRGRGAGQAQLRWARQRDELAGGGPPRGSFPPESIGTSGLRCHRPAGPHLFPPRPRTRAHAERASEMLVRVVELDKVW